MSNEIPGLLGPQGVGYIDLLDAMLTERHQAQNQKPPDKNPLRPSAAGFCARALANDYAAYRGLIPPAIEEQSPDLMRLFDLGHQIEYALIRQFESFRELFQIKYKQQVMTFHRISETEVIEGSNDLCIYLPGHRCIIDVKSKGNKWSSYRDSKWDEIDDDLANMKSVQVVNERVYWVEDLPAFLKELRDPYFRQNFVQLNLYATNEFMVSRGIDHAVILQYDKNKSRLREIRFKPSKEVEQYVINKWNNIIDAVDVKKDPALVEREFHLGSMMCSFCKHNKSCYPNDNAKKEFFATWPNKDWPRDTDRLGDLGHELEVMYSNYRASDHAEKARKDVETDICAIMDRKQIRKIRFADGEVYELKHLKSPYPRLELRRSKV